MDMLIKLCWILRASSASILIHKFPVHYRFFLFQRNQRFQAMELVDQLVPEKLDIFRINLSKAFFTNHAWHRPGRSRGESYSQFPRSPLVTPRTMTSIFARTHENKRKKKEFLAFLDSRRVCVFQKWDLIFSQPMFIIIATWAVPRTWKGVCNKKQ